MRKKEEYIRNFNGKIIGIVETWENGDQCVREFNSRKILGFYRAKYNHTTNFLGKVLSLGNSVVSLLYADNVDGK